MATTRYSTSVTLCEDTSVNYELSDLLKQADPNYSAIDPARIKLYVLDSTTNKYVEVTTGFFSAVDKDTFTVDMGSATMGSLRQASTCQVHSPSRFSTASTGALWFML